MSNAKISCCEVGEHCQSMIKSYWSDPENQLIILVVTLLYFCYFAKKKKHTKTTKTNQKKKNKQNKTKAYFCSLLVKRYEWCHICTYTTQKYNKLIDCCYLSIYKIYSGHYFLNVKHNEPHQRNYAFQEQPLCQEIYMSITIFIFSSTSLHCFLTKNPVFITFNSHTKKAFEVLKIGLLCIFWHLMWNHNHLLHRILVIIFGLNDNIQ